MTQLTCIFGRAVIAAAVLSLTAGSAQAINLTGTWAGKQTCKGSDFGFKDKFTFDDIMFITQTDDTALNIFSAGISYNGEVDEDIINPEKGQASFIACQTDPLDNQFFGEMGHATKVSTKVTGKGKFQAKSVFGGEFVAFTCTWNYKRIDTADPGVLDCLGGAAAGHERSSSKWQRR